MRNYCSYIKMTSPELRERSPVVAIIVKPDYKLNPGDPCNHSRLHWPPSYLQYASCRAAMHTVGICVLFLGWGDVFLPSTPANDRSVEGFTTESLLHVHYAIKLACRRHRIYIVILLFVHYTGWVVMLCYANFVQSSVKHWTVAHVILFCSIFNTRNICWITCKCLIFAYIVFSIFEINFFPYHWSSLRTLLLWYYW